MNPIPVLLCWFPLLTAPGRPKESTRDTAQPYASGQFVTVPLHHRRRPGTLS